MSELRPRRIWKWLAISAASVVLGLLLLLGAVSVMLSTQSGSQWALGQVIQRLNAAGSLSIEVESTRGTIFRGLSFGRMRLSNDGDSYILEDLRTSWNPYSLLTGQLVLSDIWIANLRVEMSGEVSREVPQDSDLDLSFLSTPLPMGVAISGLYVERIEFVQDEVYTFRSISFTAELNEQELNLTSLEVAFEEAELGGDFSLGLTANFPVSAQLDWRYNTRIAERDEELSGRLGLAGDLSTLQIEHQLQSPQQIQSSGSLVTGLFDEKFAIDLRHSASELTLPVEVALNYSLSEIFIGTTGSIEELSIDLQASLQLEEYPPILIDTQAVYTDTLLNVRSYKLVAANNTLSGAVNVDWSAVPQIVGDYRMEASTIDEFVSLPASLSLSELSGEGSYDISLPEAGAEGRFTIETLSGQLADYLVQGQGSLAFGQGSMRFDDIQLRTQNNQVNVSGSYSEMLDLNWTISAASLEELIPGSSGVLKGQGQLRGDLATPDITGTLFGRNTSYQQFFSDQFSIDFQRIAGQVEGEAAFETLRYVEDSVDESLSSILLLLSGSEESHAVDVTAKSKFGDIAAKVSGSVADTSGFSWEGSLESAALDTPLGTWATRSSTAMAINDFAINLGESCWGQERTLVCVTLENFSAAGISAEGSLQNFPLATFNSGGLLNSDAGPNLEMDELILLPQLPEGTILQGQLGADFSVVGAANDEMTIEFQLAASDALLLITPPQEQDESGADFEEVSLVQEYDLEVLELSGISSAGSWQLRSEARLLRENIDDSGIDARGALTASMDIAADRSLSGSIDAGLEDLRWLQALVPQFSELSGSLNAQGVFGGDLDSPELSGAVELDDAAVSINSLSIEITNISANITSDNPGSVGMTGSAQSGAGVIDFTGEILDPFGVTPTLLAEVRGSDFQLVDIADLQLHISPNIELDVNADTIEVKGSIDVPTLNLALEQLPETTVDVSRDVVIVNYPSDRPDLAYSLSRNETTVFDRPLSGVVDITLGDNVGFTGFGMNTKLQGSLNIQQTVGGSNLTYGELSLVDGTYEVYRQSLDISQGKFLFFGAYDNPGIDVRATRKVDDMTVGVLMNGTLKNISSQLFSTPALADNEIISVLVTGKRFSEIGQQDSNALLAAIASLGIDRSQGLSNQVRSKLGLDVLSIDATDDINNSVLTIGKYLTPDIFIRYGVGLFDNESKVAVDYTLSERLKLQAESGEYQSVDIIYSVER